MRDLYTPTEADILLLPVQLQEDARAGVITFADPSTWENPLKPVIRRDGKVTKGTGRIKGAKDPVLAGKESGFKRRASYHQLKERYINAGDERDPEAIMSFKELMDTLIDACNGSVQTITCTACGDKFQHAFKKDAATLFKLFENYIGKARETTQVNVTASHLHGILNEPIPIESLQVRSIDPEEQAERRKMILEAD